MHHQLARSLRLSLVARPLHSSQLARLQNAVAEQKRGTKTSSGSDVTSLGKRPEAWFKIIDPNCYWNALSQEGITNVAELKEAIKKRVKNRLKGYDTANLTIKATYNNDTNLENAKTLDPRATLKTVLEEVPFPVGRSIRKIRFFVLPPAPVLEKPIQCEFTNGSTKQKEFSNWTFKEFTDQFGIVASGYLELDRFALPPLGANKTDIKSLIDDTLNDVLRVSKACQRVCGENESERSLLIYEIIKNVVLSSPDAQLRPQLSISGRFGSGLVDFAIECNKTQILITKAKKQEMDKGFAQCGIQLDSVRHMNRERKCGDADVFEPEKLYGIVSTGDTWVPLCYENGTFKVLDQAPLILDLDASGKYNDSARKVLREGAGKLLTCILAMLHGSGPKRQKADQS